MKSHRRAFVLFVVFFLLSFKLVLASEFQKTVGGQFVTSFPLVETLPEMKIGVGGGIFFEYRFNDRFGMLTEAYYSSQQTKGRSAGEGRVGLFALPATLLKLYILSEEQRWNPYFGVGVGLYGITEGDLDNDTGGVGLGSTFEIGTNFLIADNLELMLSAAYRSIGFLTDVTGDAAATVQMPLTLQSRIGYKF